MKLQAIVLGAGFGGLELSHAVDASPSPALLVVALQGWALGQYIVSRDPVFSVYLAMLWLFAVMPLIIARTQSAQVSSGPERC